MTHYFPMKSKPPDSVASNSISKMSRRRFLGAAAATLALPTFIPASALGLDGKVAPSNRITMGMVGCGGMGTGNTNAFLSLPDCRVVAACDVDKNRLNKRSEERRVGKQC